MHCNGPSGCLLFLEVWSGAAPLDQPLAEGAGRQGVNSSLNTFFCSFRYLFSSVCIT